MAISFIPQGTHIRFMPFSRSAAMVSIILVIATIGLTFTKGMNLGIDFSGGILIEIRTENPAKLELIRPLFDKPEYGDASLQHFGDEHEVLIRLEGNADTEQSALVEAVKTMLVESIGDTIEFRRVDYVGPTVGAEMLKSGALALLFAFIGMLLYIWIRFEWQFGMGALLALIHDAILTLGFYAIVEIEFGLSAIAAILTVIGYSINDSVVIYDRIRENIRKHNGKTLDDIIDLSLNQTLSRTVLTGITTLLAAGALAWFGGEIIRGFALALCFGVIIGTYSSIYIAAPALRVFKLSEKAFDEEEKGKDTVPQFN